MDLDPFMLLANRAVFVIVPADEPRSREARTARREVDFDRVERAAAFRNQRP